MEIISINLGSYSIKFLRGEIEKRKLRYTDFHEAIINHPDPATTHEKDALSLEDIQLNLVHEYLENNPPVQKVLIDLPSHYSMLRMFTLPLRNRKKIEQIIPFQLEDELPYSIKDAHIGLFTIPLQKESYILTLSCKIKDFEQFFKKTQKLPSPPSAILSTETVFQSFILERQITDSVAIIDMGHHKSTGYLFYNKLLVATEHSFVTGKLIDEVIGETYNLDKKETITFKHESAFFLTDKQKELADPDQKEFSSLMDRLFGHFIDDFKRWSIGYQIKTRQQIKKVYITGGTSNIKNIKEYLAQKLEIPVYQFECDEERKLDDLSLPRTTTQALTVCHGLSRYLTTKESLCNFRKKSYAAPREQSLPLEAISFIGIRSLMVSALFLLVILIENVHLSNLNKDLDKKITKRLQDPAFEITPRQRRKMIKKSDSLLSFIKNKDNDLKQNKIIFDEIATIDTLKPLVQLGQIIPNTYPVEIIKFKNDNKKIQAIFKSKDEPSLDSIKKILESQRYHDAKLSVNSEQKRLELSYYEK